jgi:hypothetical protein
MTIDLVSEFAQFWVNLDILNGVIGKMQSNAPEAVAYNANVHPMEVARTAFSTDEDNNNYGATLDKIEQQHNVINEMFQHVIQTLQATVQNYDSAEAAAMSADSQAS